MAWTLACVGDLHAGSTLGLHAKTESALDDGGGYRPSKGQQWLWEKWADYYWPRVADTRREKLCLLLNGDLLDGNHHGTTQISSGNPNSQFKVLRAVMEPAFALHPDLIVVTRGTPAHVGESAAFEEIIATEWRHEGLPIHAHDTQIATWWHFVGEFDGVLIDVAHHGLGLPRRGWTRENGANLHAADVFLKHALTKRRCPDLVLRSHIHVHGDSLGHFPVRYISLPAWQLKTGYANQKVVGEVSDIGGAIAHCEDGNLTVETMLFPPEPAPVQVFA